MKCRNVSPFIKIYIRFKAKMGRKKDIGICLNTNIIKAKNVKLTTDN